MSFTRPFPLERRMVFFNNGLILGWLKPNGGDIKGGWPKPKWRGKTIPPGGPFREKNLYFWVYKKGGGHEQKEILPGAKGGKLLELWGRSSSGEK